MRFPDGTQVSFSIVPEGYDQAEVDAYLGRLWAALERIGSGVDAGAETVTVDDFLARHPVPETFAAAERGYDRGEVDRRLPRLVVHLVTKRIPAAARPTQPTRPTPPPQPSQAPWPTNSGASLVSDARLRAVWERTGAGAGLRAISGAISGVDGAAVLAVVPQGEFPVISGELVDGLAGQLNGNIPRLTILEADGGPLDVVNSWAQEVAAPAGIEAAAIEQPGTQRVSLALSSEKGPYAVAVFLADAGAEVEALKNLLAGAVEIASA